MNNFEVAFCNASSEEKLPLSNQIFIYASDNKWNDFGYNAWVNVAIFVDGYEPFESDMLIGFHARDDSNLKVKLSVNYYLEYYKTNFIEAEKVGDFFTMLPSIEDYRRLVRTFDEDVVISILSSVNDIVNRKNDMSFINIVTESDVFKLSFMRNSEPFFAFHNAELVLSYVEDELTSEISTSLNLEFKLEGFSKPHNLVINYCTHNIIPSRISVLIGRNGLGKSETLKAFCRGALRYKDKGLKLSDASGKRPLINRIIAISTPGETSSTFPLENLKKQKIYYRRLSLTRNGSRSIGDSLVQLARSEEEIAGKNRWNIFLDSLRKSFENLDSIYVQLSNNKYFQLVKIEGFSSEQKQLELWNEISKNSDPKIKKGDGYYPLSSGQLTFFKFCLLCCLHIENGSFVLMDEPETHLHPNLISDFVGILDFLLDSTNSLALIATHSAYFVREVAREQVHIFKYNSTAECIDILKPRLRTFGADVESISHFIFDEDVDNNLTEKILDRVKGLSFEEIEIAICDEVSMATLVNIKDRVQHSEEN